ncbi:hypothetical protein B0G93_11544 [Bacillus sp. V-88]|nr:hypothetical protein B1B00_14515 [Bacillus sp. DSM 27956]PRX75262.1 hypothetical protein B0G93_11544 [Bacillus sp. V-88]SLK23713.1 hypothetical protein SAMN06295884_11544 [Bacillus sp. V-88]
MNKKRIFYIILTLIFTFLLISIYSLFNGIPFGSYIAKAKITDYVKQVYSFNESVPKPQFNIKNSSYEVHLPQLGNQFSYDLSSNLIIDEKLGTEMNDTFQGDYNKLKNSYSENIELPPGFLFSSVLANGEYSKNMSLHQKMYLLGIINHKKIASEDSSNMPAILTKEIIDRLGENYNITSLQVIYTDLNGQYEITLDSKRSISVEALKKKTSKMEQIGEEGKELIRQLNEN